jgi:hypothetical protein
LIPNDTASAPGRAWLEIVKRPTIEEFAAAFAEDVVLDATVIPWPIVGVADVRRFFEATRAMYSVIIFTSEANAGARTYLEWEGEFEGADIGGTTILSRNAAGAIATIRLYHRPLAQVLAFSVDIARRLA